MSAAVLAAGVTSTFAWLTTQSRATLTSTMSVKAASSITIDVEKVGYEPSSLGTNQSAVSDASVELGTVSSVDGLKFFAPIALQAGLDSEGSVISNPYSASTFAEVTNKTAWTGDITHTNKYVGYAKYRVHVHCDAEEAGQTHILKYKVSVTADTNVEKAYRVALHETTSTWIESGEGYSKKGMWANEDENLVNAYSSATNTASAPATALADTFGSGAVSTTATTASEINKYYIFSVWVEGQDPHAINHTTSSSIAGQNLSAALEFTF